MSYRLIRPCAQCPFRTDIPPYLMPARVQEIEGGLDRGEFFCHETVDYDRYEGEEASNGQYYNPSGKEEHCAGALILLEKLNRPSQMMRILERLRNKDGSPMYNRRLLDMTAPVFDSFEAMAKAQGQARERSDAPLEASGRARRSRWRSRRKPC